MRQPLLSLILEYGGGVKLASFYTAAYLSHFTPYLNGDLSFELHISYLVEVFL